MTTGYRIVGAGLAGLLAANMLSKSRHPVHIVEAQSKLPNNHSAVLRFRSSIVADVTGVPFKEVRVMRTVQNWRNELADSIAYSFKATGTIALRSSVRENKEMATRYIAPLDLIAKLAEGFIIEYDTFNDFNVTRTMPTISTIPMPVLAKALNYHGFAQAGVEFKSVPGYNLNFRIPGIDVYGSVYLPDPNTIWNRVSITGDRVTAEYSNVKPHMVNAWLEKMATTGDFNVPARFSGYIDEALVAVGLSEAISTQKVLENDFSVRRQQYQKIMPIPDRERKRFMLWASETHNIYSLGRFATWRPGLLLDDLVNDVRQIERMADDHYHRRLKGN